MSKLQWFLLNSFTEHCLKNDQPCLLRWPTSANLHINAVKTQQYVVLWLTTLFPQHNFRWYNLWFLFITQYSMLLSNGVGLADFSVHRYISFILLRITVHFNTFSWHLTGYVLFKLWYRGSSYCCILYAVRWKGRSFGTTFGINKLHVSRFKFHCNELLV